MYVKTEVQHLTRRERRAALRSRRVRRAAAAGVLAAATAGILAGALPAGAATPNSSAAGSVSSASSHYSFKTLNDHADPTFNQLLGINDHGKIVGYFGSGTPATLHPNKGYTLTPDYDQDDYRNENFPGSQQTQVVGINDEGTTVGFWVNADGANFGFVKWHGHFYSVTNPAGTASFDQLLGVNNEGIAVGFYNDANGNSHGYTYDIKTRHFSPVNVPGATSVIATGINDDGHISGFAVLPNGSTEAFLIRHGHLTVGEFGVSTNTQALGLNDRDQVVGSYVDAAGNTHGFISTKLHSWANIDDPHAVNSTVVNGINNHGQLVGFYVDKAGNTDGLLANPR